MRTLQLQPISIEQQLLRHAIRKGRDTNLGKLVLEVKGRLPNNDKFNTLFNFLEDNIYLGNQSIKNYRGYTIKGFHNAKLKQCGFDVPQDQSFAKALKDEFMGKGPDRDGGIPPLKSLVLVLLIIMSRETFVVTDQTRQQQRRLLKSFASENTSFL